MLPISPQLLYLPRNKAAAVAGFTPASIASLYIWLKSTAGLFQDSGFVTPASADGDLVGGWQDQSGNARHFTQSDANQVPVLKTGILNGLPILRSDGTTFAGVGKTLIGPNMSALTAGEIFIIVAALADPGASTVGAGLWKFGTSGSGELYPFNGDANIYEEFGSTTRSATGNPTPALTSFRLYNVVTTSSELTTFIDGTQFFTTATNTVGFSTTPWLFQGANSSFSGDIAEAVICSAKISGSDKTNLKAYFASRYGLTIA